MRIAVYPHAMEIGGSQLNALELAAAVRDRDHEVVVVGEPGPLVDTVHGLGLAYVPIPADRRRPSPQVSRLLTRLAADRGIDVVHGYEWPPGLEAYFGPRLRLGVPAVCTVLSMAVAPFLPRRMPLVVGTEEIRRRAVADGHTRVTVVEPPINTTQNAPDYPAGRFRVEHGLDGHTPLVVVVGRLARELKREGLLAACAVVGELNRDGTAVQLAVVGDGPERAGVAAAAAAANARAGRRAVVLTGTLADPRPAYAAADVTLGMGGSALRAMAFGKPLIVQGERGYWRTCTPESLPEFLHGGWYGLGEGTDGCSRLRAELEPLLARPDRRAELGAFARTVVVERFSLHRAAEVLAGVYATVLGQPAPARADVLRAAVGVAGYQLRRKLERRLGSASRDDFNALASSPP